MRKTDLLTCLIFQFGTLSLRKCLIRLKFVKEICSAIYLIYVNPSVSKKNLSRRILNKTKLLIVGLYTNE